MAEPDAASAGELSLDERTRRAADADAAALQAERERDAAKAIERWLEALRECHVVPDSLKVQLQSALFPEPDAELYGPLLKSDASQPTTLSTLVAQFRYSHLVTTYDYEPLCAQFAEHLADKALSPAVACLWRELLTKSARACELALGMRPDDVDVVCASARHSLNAGRLEDASERLEAFMRGGPGVAEPMELLRRVDAELLDKAEYVRRRMQFADELIAQSHYDLALAELDAARRQHGESSDALAKAAWCLAELGRTEDARNAARRSVELNRQSAEAHLALGTVLRKRGEFEEAAAELDLCAETAGADNPLHGQAREIASDVYADLGEEAYLRGELDRAARLYQDAVDRNETCGLAIQRMAQLAELRRDYAAAARLWQKLVDSGQGERAWRARACASIADGSDEALLAAAEQCAANGEVRWADDILRLIENAQLREQHDLFQNIPAALSELNSMCGRGWDWFVSGDHTRAKEHFLKARPLCPNDQRILRGLGFALAAEAENAFGQARRELVEEAIEVLQKAIAVNPTNEDADAARNKLKWLDWQR